MLHACCTNSIGIFKWFFLQSSENHLCLQAYWQSINGKCIGCCGRVEQEGWLCEARASISFILRRGDMSHQYTILVITLVILVAILLVYKYTVYSGRGTCRTSIPYSYHTCSIYTGITSMLCISTLFCILQMMQTIQAKHYTSKTLYKQNTVQAKHYTSKTKPGGRHVRPHIGHLSATAHSVFLHIASKVST